MRVISFGFIFLSNSNSCIKMNTSSAKTPPKLIRTNRLILRKPKIEDAEYIHLHHKNDACIDSHFDFEPNPDLCTICRAVLRTISAWNSGTLYHYVIESIQTAELVGFIALDFSGNKLYSQAIARRHQGNGYMNEAVLSLCEQISLSDLDSTSDEHASLGISSPCFRERLSKRFEQTIRYRLLNRKTETREAPTVRFIK